MTAERQIDPPDPPTPLSALITTIQALTAENVALRAADDAKDIAITALKADVRRLVAAGTVEWAPIKTVASLTGKPYSTVYRWKRDDDITWREAHGRVEVLLKSVFDHIRRLGLAVESEK